MKTFKTILWILSAFAGLNLHADEAAVRIGHFPNITHAQAILGHATGAFDKALGQPVEWKIFNAGPAAMEALMGGHLDVAYVGPNPAINAYTRSEGRALRVVAGASSGGASLIIRPASGIQTEKDFANKKITTPQLGNTQDVAAREWLISHGYQFTDKGGNVTILPIPNPEQLTLFQKGQIDGAWVPEPWATRFVQELKGRRMIDERDLWPEKKFCSALVIVRKEFLDANPGLIKKILEVHVELTEKIRANPALTQKIINDEIGREMGKPLSVQLLEESWKWFDVTYDPLSATLLKSADSAFKLGFLGRQKPNLSGITDLRILNEVLADKKLEPIK